MARLKFKLAMLFLPTLIMAETVVLGPIIEQPSPKDYIGISSFSKSQDVVVRYTSWQEFVIALTPAPPQSFSMRITRFADIRTSSVHSYQLVD